MTRPSVIYFGSDGSRHEDRNNRPKIFLRALLISNSKRGRVVENLFATLTQQETRQNFNIWVYGDENLVRGSGLHVSDAGIATNHHFLLPPENFEFRFKSGNCQLEIFAHVLGNRRPIKLLSQALNINDAEASAISSNMCGLYFDWGPQSNGYKTHLESSPRVSQASLMPPIKDHSPLPASAN